MLQEAIFLGDHVRLRLSMGDGGEILAKRPAGIGALPEPGGPAAIACRRGRLRVPPRRLTQRRLNTCAPEVATRRQPGF